MIAASQQVQAFFNAPLHPGCSLNPFTEGVFYARPLLPKMSKDYVSPSLLAYISHCVMVVPDYAHLIFTTHICVPVCYYAFMRTCLLPRIYYS